jgi:hypothetical protein
MSDDTALSCPDCDRTFVSGRALTQHARYVHEGAALFGQRLVDASEELIDPDSADRYWVEATQEDDEAKAEPEPAAGEDTWSLWPIAFAMAGIALALLLRSLPPEPRSEKPGSPKPPYGPGSPFGTARG